MLSASISPRRSNCAGDGSADIGAHDDAHCLLQLHDARVDETDAHDGGGGGAWISPVTTAPEGPPLNTLLVRRSRICSSLPLESFSRPSVMVDIPNRNVAMAPNMATIFAISTMLPQI